MGFQHHFMLNHVLINTLYSILGRVGRGAGGVHAATPFAGPLEVNKWCQCVVSIRFYTHINYYYMWNKIIVFSSVLRDFFFFWELRWVFLYYFTIVLAHENPLIVTHRWTKDFESVEESSSLRSVARFDQFNWTSLSLRMKSMTWSIFTLWSVDRRCKYCRNTVSIDWNSSYTESQIRNNPPRFTFSIHCLVNCW